MASQVLGAVSLLRQESAAVKVSKVCSVARRERERERERERIRRKLCARERERGRDT